MQLWEIKNSINGKLSFSDWFNDNYSSNETVDSIEHVLSKDDGTVISFKGKKISSCVYDYYKNASNLKDWKDPKSYINRYCSIECF